MYQHLPLQEPPKLTQIGIFGLKYACHLATLAQMANAEKAKKSSFALLANSKSWN
jgi:hypothetical protein